MKKLKERTENRTPISHVGPETLPSVDQSLLPIDHDSKKPLAPSAQPWILSWLFYTESTELLG